eukprot:11172878-Lingulodinium_polyedra.AAC.1
MALRRTACNRCHFWPRGVATQPVCCSKEDVGEPHALATSQHELAHYVGGTAGQTFSPANANARGARANAHKPKRNADAER